MPDKAQQGGEADRGAQHGARRDRDRAGRFLPGVREKADGGPRGRGRRWRPGESGNPGGQPKTITGEIRRLLRDADRTGEVPPLPGPIVELMQEYGAEDLGQLLARVLVTEALNPKSRPENRLAALRQIQDRVEGPLGRERGEGEDGDSVREIIIISPSEAMAREAPAFPEEVLEIERLEAEAEAERQRRRDAAMGIERDERDERDERRNGSHGRQGPREAPQEPEDDEPELPPEAL